MPDVEPRQNPVHEFIVRAVQSAWNATHDGEHKAMLLSALGSKLKSEFGDYSAEFPKGIKEFLRTWPLVQVVEHPEIKEKIGLVPAGERLPADVTVLFQKAGARHSPTSIISYEQAFWNAFFKPIQSTRYVVLQDNGQVEILDDAAQIPDGSYEITKDDVFTPDPATPMEEKVAATREKIDSWLARNSLDRSQFFRKHATKPASSPARLDSLKHAFEKISDADRSRVLIPLDILLKIIS
jgi:hypothetical protein